MLDYVNANAESGNLDSVISTIDKFCYGTHWMMNLGDEKGQIVDNTVKKYSPKTILEMGTYCGYSSCRLVKLLPEDGFMISLEISEDNAKIARQVHKKAGIDHRITVLVGDAKSSIPKVQDLLATKGFKSIDLVFIDHDKKAYLHDLLVTEQHNLLHKGSVVVADNVVVFAIKDYLDHVRDKKYYSSSELFMSRLEYVTDKDKQIEDGVEVSIYDPQN